ncbi:MAG TPA: ComC/BlpC family leader-containing pheromone/bacteriocin [Candidatus Mediterraneibacter intestinipullorum]|nr:ComC/BlpC family leader-containing pheromone/bacteriocin [Candidatus Mediterraneibacter intestinipullorum]
MNLALTDNFCEITNAELEQISGGDVFGFVGDIYSKWCDIWYDFGANIYHITH